MSDAAFYEPYIAQWRTPFLGTSLRPLTLGHLILLQAIECSFLSPDATPDLSDLSASVFICCNTYRNALEALPTNAAKKELGKWQKELGAFDFHEACKEFREYLAVWMKEPCVRWMPSPSGGEQGGTIPRAQGVKVSLMQDLGFTEAELMDRSWRLCLLDWYTHKAIRGDLTFVDEAERDLISKISLMTPEQLEAACKEARNGKI